MAAEVIAHAAQGLADLEGHGEAVSVSVFDRMPTFGRKFLMAGRGGLNLTHSEDLDGFLSRYGAAASVLAPAIQAWPPERSRSWAGELGQETFVGTSGRVFPVAMKASPLLRAWLRRLSENGVGFQPRYRWLGFDAGGGLRFDTPEGVRTLTTDATVLAMGGGSWARLGSDGAWSDILKGEGVEVVPFAASNCGFLADWSDHFRERFQGQPLKRIAISCSGHQVRGETVVTAEGLEGGAVYQMSGVLREAFRRDGEAEIAVDLRPDLTTEALVARLSASRGKQSMSTFLRKAAKLSPVAIGLLQEDLRRHDQQAAGLSAGDLARHIKSVGVRLTGLAAIDRAISTVGGLALDELDERFMLKRRPGVFCAGEMLDWDAPTGGYLLQACLATGAAAGRGVLNWLNRAGQ